MKLITNFLSILTLTLFFVHQTVACSCIEYYTPECAKVVRSDAVFFGKIEKLFWVTEKEDKTKVLTETDAVKYSVKGDLVARFSVIEKYKGDLGNTIDVYSNIGSNCTGDFSNIEIGDTWTIYADFGTNSKQWFTEIGICGYSHSGKSNLFLQNYKQGKTTSSVQGKVIEGLSPWGAMSGVPVRIEGDGFQASTTTIKGEGESYQSNGTFNIEVPKPGTYKVSLVIPSSVTALSFMENIDIKSFPAKKDTRVEYLVNVPKGLCHFTQLQTHPKN